MKPLFVFALALFAGGQQAAQQKPPATGAPKDFVLPAAKRFTYHTEQTLVRSATQPLGLSRRRCP